MRPTRCLSSRAAALNCRIMPGEPVDEVLATLGRVLADDQILVDADVGEAVLSPPSALDAEIMGAIERSRRSFGPAPGHPDHERGRDRRQLPAQCRHPGLRTFRARRRLGDYRAHGRDERVPVKSFFEGQEYLYRLVKMLAGG